MNALSIIIYLADTLPRFGTIAALLGTLALLISPILIIIGKFVVWDMRWKDKDKIPNYDTTRTKIGEYGVRLLFASVVALGVATLIPSQKTFYMIAASEIGENVITHPDTVEIYTELKDLVLTKLKEYNISKEE